MSPVIKVENLSKLYRLGVINRDMLYKDLQSRWAKFRGKEDPNAPIGFKHDKRLEHGDEFWALRNVDLEVKEAEILGIIGRNGAGKSTLLKILSQITAPTEGKIKVKGRIASLLEVGTGFHQELTGSENVYLNGAILGMTRREVRSKFDEIVAFAEIGEFIDTPVKRYSSGMYVRLAFAVAAHLDPEILIVDEVLAVGDAAFQKKCLGKMKNVSGQQGRTVLFVSHNMASIQHLCQRVALLHDGRISQDGDSEQVVGFYLNGMRSADEEASYVKSFDGNFALTHTVLRNQTGAQTTTFRLGDTLIIEIHYDAKEAIDTPYFWVGMSGNYGDLLGASMLLDGFRPRRIEGKGFVRAKFPDLPLRPQNSYFVQAGMRYKDAKTSVIPSGDIAHFHVAGSAAESGFTSPVAEEFLMHSGGIVAKYEWELSSGENFTFDPSRKST